MHLIAPVLAVLAASPVVADDLGPRQNPLPIQTGEPDVLHVVHRRSRQTQDGSTVSLPSRARVAKSRTASSTWAKLMASALRSTMR